MHIQTALTPVKLLNIFKWMLFMADNLVAVTDILISCQIKNLRKRIIV